MISKTTGVRIIGSCLLAVSLFTVSHVQAADLGGDCCADLEERVADLEANTARKGNRKVSLKISGWVAQNTISDETLQLLLAMNALPNALETEKALHRLAPKAQYAHVNSTLHSTISFGNSLLSCGVRDGEHAFSREGQCVWAKVTANRLDHDVTSEAPGLDKTGAGLSAGVQFRLVDEWRLGFAAGYENTASKQFDSLQALDKITGDVVSIGSVLKNRWGPISAALSVSGSYGWHDSKRFVGLVGVGDIAQSNQNVGSLSTRARMSILLGSKSFYMKPMIGLSTTWLHLGSYRETGAGGANLHQESASQWILSATPALEIGGEITGADGLLWRPYVRAGLLVHDRDNLQVQTGFIADPAGGLTSWDASFNKIHGELQAGLNVLTTQGLNLKFSYEGRFGEHTRAHSGNLKISLKF